MHDIIFLWSHPRSLSSVMQRVMQERGDLRNFHEPFIYTYYVHKQKKTLVHFDIDDTQPTTYEHVKAMLTQAADVSPVFVKDMCYYVDDELCADEAFLRRARHTFLIRDPEKSILSYYRIDPSLSSEEIGLEAQWRVFEAVRERSGETPVVLDAADLQNDPEAALRAYCDAVGLAFIPAAMHWQGEAIPPDWQYVAGWHQSLAGSTGIRKQKPSASAGEAGLDADPKLRAFHEHHLPFYRQLHSYRLRPG